MRDCLGWKVKMVSQLGVWSRISMKESTELVTVRENHFERAVDIRA